MNREPLVSVVMSVRNGECTLRDSVGSVLSQEGIELEFIIVDDGSTDASGAILDELAARDSRIRVVHQANTGLTRALIRGCAMARGAYIARQDCGDLSLPGRFLTQLPLMDANPGAALASCGTRIVGPKGEHLYDVAIPPGEATALLRADVASRVRGPWHGSAVFRRDFYQRVGGYREEFYFAQDLDLWTRLAAHAEHVVSPAVLYQASFTPGSISGAHRRRQEQCKRLIVECAARRRAGLDERELLERASRIVPGRQRGGRYEVAAASYFIGMCLRARGDARARDYFQAALRANPLHVKSFLRLALT